METTASSSIVSITDKMLEFVDGEIGEAFSQVGIGISSVMVLILCFYFIASMMNGSRFQLKMLLPMLVFLLVCNFSWISQPVTGFTRTITKALCEGCVNSKIEVMHEYGGDDCNDIMTLFWHFKDSKKTKSRTDTESKATEEISGKSETRPETNNNSTVVDQEKAEDTKWYTRMFNSFLDAINKKETDGKLAIIENTTLSKEDKDTVPLSHITLSGIIAYIISYVSNILSYCLQAMGIMMTSVIVAFGPITFAFALFPGRASSVVTWFIRICQFALYAPVASLVDCFSIKIMCLFYDPTVEISFLLLFAVLVCNLVCLTSVPTISSMIIEGASGAVSLTGGLQSMASALTQTGSLLAGGTVLMAGKNGGLSEALSGIRGEGLVKFGKDVADNGFSKAFNNAKTFGQNH